MLLPYIYISSFTVNFVLKIIKKVSQESWPINKNICFQTILFAKLISFGRLWKYFTDNYSVITVISASILSHCKLITKFNGEVDITGKSEWLKQPLTQVTALCKLHSCTNFNKPKQPEHFNHWNKHINYIAIYSMLIPAVTFSATNRWNQVHPNTNSTCLVSHDCNLTWISTKFFYVLFNES